MTTLRTVSLIAVSLESVKLNHDRSVVGVVNWKLYLAAVVLRFQRPSAFYYILARARLAKILLNSKIQVAGFPFEDVLALALAAQLLYPKRTCVTNPI